jgi:hypothetical protein
MRKVLIGIGVTLLAAALGLGAAYGGSELWKYAASQQKKTSDTAVPAIVQSAPRSQALPDERANPRWRSNPDEQTNPQGRSNPGESLPGRMQRYSAPADTEPISTETAIQKAEALAARISPDVQLAEVMEFQDNFYTVFVEQDSGRGAFEILVDRYRRGAGMEPTMMWNLKYGMPMHRVETEAEDNSVSLEEARAAAQQYLDDRMPGATLAEDGYAFYGYYTFDYSQNGEVAGMLSVNGLTGQVWPHTWHGDFVQEVEVEQ